MQSFCWLEDVDIAVIPKRWEALPEELSAHFDLLAWFFANTQELPELHHVIDQERAVRAVE